MREDIVENEVAAAGRTAEGMEGQVRRVTGLTALQVMLDRRRRVREAVHKLRLKAGMIN